MWSKQMAAYIILAHASRKQCPHNLKALHSKQYNLCRAYYVTNLAYERSPYFQLNQEKNKILALGVLVQLYRHFFAPAASVNDGKMLVLVRSSSDTTRLKCSQFDQSAKMFIACSEGNEKKKIAGNQPKAIKPTATAGNVRL